MTLLLLLRSSGQDRFMAATLEATADLLADVEVDRALAIGLSGTADLAADVEADRAFAASLHATADLSVNLSVAGSVFFAATLGATADMLVALGADRRVAALLVADVEMAAAIERFHAFKIGSIDTWTIPAGGKLWKVPGTGRTWRILSPDER